MTRVNSGTYLGGIDGIRAIAVLAVIGFHADFLSFLPGGFSGVDVFFVVSGYVISKSLAGHEGEGFFRYLGGFYARRMRRILPALLVCLLATVALSVLFVPSVWMSREHEVSGLAAFFGVSNFFLAAAGNDYFSPGTDLNPFLHTWSLGVEEQFYLFYPVVFLVWLGWRRRPGVIGHLARFVLPALALASLGFAYYETTANPTNAFYLLPSRFWELAAGGLLYQAHAGNRLLPGTRRLGEGILFAGLVLTLLGFFIVREDMFPFPAALMPVIGTALMISGIAGMSGGLISSGLGSGPLAYVGRISYSLYLWHWPVLVLARWTVGFADPLVIALYLPVVFGLAALSYHFIEMPIRTGVWLRRRPNWQLVTSGFAAVVIFWLGAGQLFEAKPVIGLSATKNEAEWRSVSWVQARDLGELVGDTDLSGRRLFSFGDSHAAAYRTLLKEVSANLGVEIIEHERGDCPYPVLLEAGSERPDCAGYWADAIADIKANARPGDFVLLAGLRVPELNGDDLDWNVQEARERLAPARVAAGLADAIAAFEDLDMPGVHFIIDAPAPVMPAPTYRCADWFNAMNPVCASGLEVDRTLFAELRQPVVDSMETLAARFADLTVWDPLPILCPSEVCSARDSDGRPLFFDSDHLSGHGNRVLTPSFIGVMLDLVRGEGGAT